MSHKVLELESLQRYHILPSFQINLSIHSFGQYIFIRNYNVMTDWVTLEIRNVTSHLVQCLAQSRAIRVRNSTQGFQPQLSSCRVLSTPRSCPKGPLALLVCHCPDSYAKLSAHPSRSGQGGLVRPSHYIGPSIIKTTLCQIF